MSRTKGELYEVENVLDHKTNRRTGEMLYLVKWKNYPPEQNTWEPESSFASKKAISQLELYRNKETEEEEKSTTSKPKSKTKPARSRSQSRSRSASKPRKSESSDSNKGGESSKVSRGRKRTTTKDSDSGSPARSRSRSVSVKATKRKSTKQPKEEEKVEDKSSKTPKKSSKKKTAGTESESRSRSRSKPRSETKSKKKERTRERDEESQHTSALPFSSSSTSTDRSIIDRVLNESGAFDSVSTTIADATVKDEFSSSTSSSPQSSPSLFKVLFPSLVYSFILITAAQSFVIMIEDHTVQTAFKKLFKRFFTPAHLDSLFSLLVNWHLATLSTVPLYFIAGKLFQSSTAIAFPFDRQGGYACAAQLLGGL